MGDVRFWNPARTMLIGIIAIMGLFLGTIFLWINGHPVWAVIAAIAMVLVLALALNKAKAEERSLIVDPEAGRRKKASDFDESDCGGLTTNTD